MWGATTPANSASFAVNSTKCHRPWRWIPGTTNRCGHVIGLLWIVAGFSALSRNVSGRRETLFDIENAKTGASQILICLCISKITTFEVATVNNNYRRVCLTVVSG